MSRLLKLIKIQRFTDSNICLFKNLIIQIFLDAFIPFRKFNNITFSDFTINFLPIRHIIFVGEHTTGQ